MYDSLPRSQAQFSAHRLMDNGNRNARASAVRARGWTYNSIAKVLAQMSLKRNNLFGPRVGHSTGNCADEAGEPQHQQPSQRDSSLPPTNRCDCENRALRL